MSLVAPSNGNSFLLRAPTVNKKTVEIIELKNNNCWSRKMYFHLKGEVSASTLAHHSPRTQCKNLIFLLHPRSKSCPCSCFVLPQAKYNGDCLGQKCLRRDINTNINKCDFYHCTFNDVITEQFAFM